MKKIFKTVTDFLDNKQKENNLNQSKKLLMELTVKDRTISEIVELKKCFDNDFNVFLRGKKIETEENLKAINSYEK